MIKKLKDLKDLQMVLETFIEKKFKEKLLFIALLKNLIKNNKPNKQLNLWTF